MELSLKTLVKLGGAAGAISAIVGVVALARPIMQSDPAPLAGQARVLQVDGKLGQLAQNFQMMQQQQQQMQQNQLFLAQGFWTNQLVLAQQELRRNPSNLAARQQIANAQNQLNMIQKQLFGGAP